MIEPVIIGNATLYHADCREILPMLAGKGKEQINAVITDPPYGHNNNNNDLIHRWEAALGHGPCGEARPIANDGVEANELFKKTLPLLFDLLSPGGCCCCCCCGGGGPDPQFARWSLWMDEIFDFKQMIVWDKGPIGMGWHYRRSYETILVGQKPGKKCAWYDETNRIENIIRPGQYGIKKIIPQSNDHPTPKPPQLAAYFCSLHTKLGDIILDPFMGAGWVGVGVLPSNRRFIGIEIDKNYFDIACQRIEDAQRQQRMF